MAYHRLQLRNGKWKRPRCVAGFLFEEKKEIFQLFILFFLLSRRWSREKKDGKKRRRSLLFHSLCLMMIHWTPEFADVYDVGNLLLWVCFGHIQLTVGFSLQKEFTDTMTTAVTISISVRDKDYRIVFHQNFLRYGRMLLWKRRRVIRQIS